MSSDLVYRMRTCAAAIAASQESGDPWDTTRIATDAADLLLEASNEIAQEDFLGEPMEIIKPLPPKPVEGPTWLGATDTLPTVMNLGPHQPKPCPSCHILAPHTVHRAKNNLVLKMSGLWA